MEVYKGEYKSTKNSLDYLPKGMSVSSESHTHGSRRVSHTSATIINFRIYCTRSLHTISYRHKICQSVCLSVSLLAIFSAYQSRLFEVTS